MLSIIQNLVYVNIFLSMHMHVYVYIVSGGAITSYCIS